MKEALTILNNNLDNHQTVVIGLSGGPDSMFLLWLLLEVRKTKDIKIVAAHVNHHIRKASGKEAKKVKKFCLQNNIEYEQLDITEYSKANFHHQAREKRYRFFKELMKKYQATVLLTAHHGDDLMETILMRLVRGSSLKGYGGFRGILEIPEGKVIRPLIYLSKDEIKKYNNDLKIPYVTDKSNSNTKYTRNRYRQNILPFLKKENQQVIKSFNNFKDMINESEDYVDKVVQLAVKDVYDQGKIDLKKFNTCDEFIGKRIICNLLDKIYGDKIYLINQIHVEDILKLIKSKKSNGMINLPNNVIITKHYQELVINEQQREEKINSLLADNLIINEWQFNIVNDNKIKSNYYLRLNSKIIIQPLRFRNWQPNDKMVIKNMDKSKMVRRIFIDEKVPTSKRLTYPILVDGNNEVLWLPGLKKSHFDELTTGNYDIIIKATKIKEK